MHNMILFLLNTHTHTNREKTEIKKSVVSVYLRVV